MNIFGVPSPEAHSSEPSWVIPFCAGVAVLLHGVLLYAAPWMPIKEPLELQQHQGIIIEMETSPPAETLEAPQEPTPPSPPPEPESEPEPEPEPTPAPENMLEKQPPPQKERHEPRRQKAKSQKPSPSRATPAPLPVSKPAAAPAPAPSVITVPKPLPKYLNNKPPYPELARRRGQEGKVIVLAHIDAEGKITDVDVAQSSGHFLLDEGAKNAIRRWRFTPSRKDGVPIPSSVLVPVDFRLKQTKNAF